MVKQKQFIGNCLSVIDPQNSRTQFVSNCLSVIDHFVGLALKGLNPFHARSPHYFNFFRVRLKRLIPILSEFEQINELLFPLKFPSLRFSDDFRESRS